MGLKDGEGVPRSRPTSRHCGREDWVGTRGADFLDPGVQLEEPLNLFFIHSPIPNMPGALHSERGPVRVVLSLATVGR